MNEDKLKEQLIALGPWFHQIEITPTLRTRDIAPSPGPQPKDHPASRWNILKNYIPDNLAGKRVLDLGCADGFFSIEMARRGAQVVAIDAAPKMIARLNWAAQTLGLQNILAKVGTVEDLNNRERYDFVLFIAVLYHLKNPLLGLEKVASVTDTIYLETAIHDGKEPYMYFKPPQPGVHQIPKWFPTKSCVVDMLKFTGFNHVQALPDPMESRAIYMAARQ